MVETEVRPGTISRRLIVVWGSLALLVGAIAAIQTADRAGTAGSDVPTGRDPRQLVPVPVAELDAVEIAHSGILHRFQRNADRAWFYHGVHSGAQTPDHAHQIDAAIAQRIEQAFTVFARTRTERQFPLANGGKEYGLAQPKTVILLYRAQDAQPLVQIAVGDVAPDSISRYITVVGSASAITIPDYQITNLLELLGSVTGGAAGEQPSAALPR
jgi:hypothetical protein